MNDVVLNIMAVDRENANGIFDANAKREGQDKEEEEEEKISAGGSRLWC
jgi:hypothetical protein